MPDKNKKRSVFAPASGDDVKGRGRAARKMYEDDVAGVRAATSLKDIIKVMKRDIDYSIPTNSFVINHISDAMDERPEVIKVFANALADVLVKELMDEEAEEQIFGEEDDNELSKQLDDIAVELRRARGDKKKELQRKYDEIRRNMLNTKKKEMGLLDESVFRPADEENITSRNDARAQTEYDENSGKMIERFGDLPEKGDFFFAHEAGRFGSDETIEVTGRHMGAVTGRRLYWRRTDLVDETFYFSDILNSVVNMDLNITELVRDGVNVKTGKKK